MRECRIGQLIGSKTFELKLDPKRRRSRIPRTTPSSARRSPARISPTRSPVVSRTCRTSACRAWRMRESCRQPRSRHRSVLQRCHVQEDSRLSRGQQGRTSSLSVAQNEWAAIKHAAHKSRVVVMGRVAKSIATMGRLQRHDDRPRRNAANRGRPGPGPSGRGESVGPRTTSRSIRTARSVRHARSPNSMPASSWTASQQTHLLRRQIAHMLGLQDADVRASMSKGRDATGAMAMRTRPMRR